MTTAAKVFPHSVPCCQGSDPEDGPCICSPEERVLRAYIGHYSNLPPMTGEERGWCLEEIHHVEGYDRADYQDASDADLARGVLHAWADSARDHGLL